MKEKIILIGAGGYSKSVIDSLDMNCYEIFGFIDENKSGEHLGYKIIANNLENILDIERYKFFISIGDNLSRKFWFEKLKEKKLKSINIIDKTAVVSSGAKLGEGVFVGKLAVINREAKIEDNTIINTRAIIEHGSIILKNSNISTNTVVNGDVLVGEGSFIGSCTVVNGQIKIGKNSIVGSGSVVIKNVEDNVVMAGVPAKLIRRVG